jgi:hypothetical protein
MNTLTVTYLELLYLNSLHVYILRQSPAAILGASLFKVMS